LPFVEPYVDRPGFMCKRDQVAAVVKKWQAAGSIDPKADPHALAQLIMSISFGFVAQRALAGSADPTGGS
jgi:hypothetical protein